MFQPKVSSSPKVPDLWPLDKVVMLGALFIHASAEGIFPNLKGG